MSKQFLIGALCTAALIAILFALDGRAMTIVFPRGSVDVRLELDGEDCGEGWAAICVTSLPRQRTYLLALADDGRFIGESYRVLLKRGVEDAGLEFYLGRLTARTITREQIIDQIVGSPEYKRLHP